MLTLTMNFEKEISRLDAPRYTRDLDPATWNLIASQNCCRMWPSFTSKHPTAATQRPWRWIPCSSRPWRNRAAKRKPARSSAWDAVTSDTHRKWDAITRVIALREAPRWKSKSRDAPVFLSISLIKDVIMIKRNDVRNESRLSAIIRASRKLMLKARPAESDKRPTNRPDGR